MTRIKASEVKAVREELLAQQGGCAICGEQPKVPHLDHDHKTGLIRGVLCSNHNMYLGKIENSCARYLISRDQLADILEKTATYLRLHETDQTGLLYPTHLTDDEKKTRAKKRRQKKLEQNKGK